MTGSTGPAGDDPRAYLPGDRRRALAAGTELADRVRGSGLFADISGFTPLTETLARELGPQRGVEELTAQLNRVFEAVIADVHRFGGEVIYFSGDAITCWLEGDDGTRATAAGLAIQETMSGAVGRVVTPASTEIPLAIKVAIAVGPARRFVVGDPTIQLIDVLAGSIVDELADAEQLAQKGEVVLTASALTALGARVRLAETRTQAADDDGAADVIGVVGDLEVEVTELLPGEEPALSEELVRPWSLPLVYQRLRAGRGEFLAELRSAYPLFARFGGIDYDDDPDAPERLDEFVRLSQAVFSRHGGNLLQLTLGDKGAYLYAVFGSPQAHGDDAARACGAALELRAVALDTAARDLQIGITNGRLRSGTYGHPMRRTFTCLGDAVNLAARLMSKAPAGHIYVSDDVRRASGDRYLWRDVGPMPVKGKREAVEVWELRAVAGRSRRRELRYPLPMLGRAGEMQAITAAADHVRAGRGSRVLGIAAEAGRGKSRLIAEVARRLRSDGMTVVFGEAPTIGGHLGYAIWREVWRTLLGVDEDEPEEDQRRAVHRSLASLGAGPARRAPLLGPVLGLDIPDNEVTRPFDAKLRKTSLEGLLTDLLLAATADDPLTVVLEDCHAIDPLSRDLLDVLVRAAAAHPVLFLVAYRPGDQPAGGLRLEGLPQFTELALDELDAATAEAVAMEKLHQLYGTDTVASPELLAMVVERAHGNPFYLEELINFLHERRIDPADPEQLHGLDLPGSLHNLVLSRIDRLDEDPRRTLKVASVLGRTFVSPTVQRVYPALGQLPVVEQHLDACRTADLVVVDQLTDASWLFRHVVTREVAYESLPFALREELHARAGEDLERAGPEAIEDTLDLLAHHFWHSADLAKKIHYLERAGDAAQARYANAASIVYFQRLANLVGADDRCGVLRKLGKVHELVGSWDRAREVLGEALSVAVAAGDRSAEAWCEVSLAEVSRKQGQYPEAVDRLRHAAQLFDETADAAGTGQVLHLAGTVAAQRGDNATARAHYLESLAIRRELGDRPAMAAVLSNLGVVAEYEGDFPASRAYHEEALELRTAIGDRWAIAVSRTNLGMIAVLQGRADDARKDFDEAMRLNQEVGDSWMVAISHHNLANAHRDLGDYEAARTHYGEAAKAFHRYDDQWALAFLFEDVASLAWSTGAPEVACELLGAADRSRDEIGSPRAASLEAELASRSATTEIDDVSAAGARARGRQQSAELSVNTVLQLCSIGGPPLSRASHTA